MLSRKPAVFLSLTAPLLMSSDAAWTPVAATRLVPATDGAGFHSGTAQAAQREADAVTFDEQPCCTKWCYENPRYTLDAISERAFRAESKAEVDAYVADIEHGAARSRCAQKGCRAGGLLALLGVPALGWGLQCGLHDPCPKEWPYPAGPCFDFCCCVGEPEAEEVNYQVEPGSENFDYLHLLLSMSQADKQNIYGRHNMYGMSGTYDFKTLADYWNSEGERCLVLPNGEIDGSRVLKAAHRHVFASLQSLPVMFGSTSKKDGISVEIVLLKESDELSWSIVHKKDSGRYEKDSDADCAEKKKKIASFRIRRSREAWIVAMKYAPYADFSPVGCFLASLSSCLCSAFGVAQLCCSCSMGTNAGNMEAGAALLQTDAMNSFLLKKWRTASVISVLKSHTAGFWVAVGAAVLLALLGLALGIYRKCGRARTRRFRPKQDMLVVEHDMQVTLDQQELLQPPATGFLNPFLAPDLAAGRRGLRPSEGAATSDQDEPCSDLESDDGGLAREA